MVLVNSVAFIGTHRLDCPNAHAPGERVETGTLAARRGRTDAPSQGQLAALGAYSVRRRRDVGDYVIVACEPSPLGPGFEDCPPISRRSTDISALVEVPPQTVTLT